ncbi:kinase-like domain-containing protein [Dipodascopsis uninucleata]
MTGSMFIPECIVPLLDTEAQEVATRQLLMQVFPSWVNDRLEIVSLKGGITNSLLQCTYKARTADEQTVLVRAYGRGTDTIIDRTREYCTHIHLHSHGLAPPLYARFKNGLVYGFISGRSVEYQELSNPVLMKGISRMLSQWHTVLNPKCIKQLIVEQQGAKQSAIVDDIWQLCSKWISNLPVDTPKRRDNKVLLENELLWVKNEIACKGGPIVVAHCDLLSGNVIVPEEWPRDSNNTLEPPPVTFIDYEYALPTPRAFDLANHFMEWQGFDCNIALIPEVGGEVMREWGRQYLEGVKLYSRDSEKLDVPDNEINVLMDEIRCWWGMPGFYWGIWATIQSIISTIDFDYESYAEKRLLEYWNWKKTYVISKGKLNRL